MADDDVLLAEGKLTAFAIDFDHPTFCQFQIEGRAERFMAARSMALGVSRTAVVLVAYLPGERYAEVLGMIVLRCGRSSSAGDREALRGAVIGDDVARRILRSSIEWAEVKYLGVRALGASDLAVVVDARVGNAGPFRRGLAGLPGESATIFAAPRALVAADLASIDPRAAMRLLDADDPDRPLRVAILTPDGDVEIVARAMP